MIGVTFVVRWQDENAKPRSKSYDNEVDARKAKQWLLEHGAPSVDIAVALAGRERLLAEKDNTKPVQSESQKMF